jgi:hypothetical protein
MKRTILIVLITLMLILSAVDINLSYLTLSIGARVKPFIIALFVFIFALLIWVLSGCIISIKR